MNDENAGNLCKFKINFRCKMLSELVYCLKLVIKLRAFFLNLLKYFKLWPFLFSFLKLLFKNINFNITKNKTRLTNKYNQDSFLSYLELCLSNGD